MAAYQLKQPSVLFGGEGSAEKIIEIVGREKAGKVMVFTDKGVRAAGLLDILLGILAEIPEVDFRVVDQLATEPAYGDVDRLMEEVNAYDADLMIALGGGSVMDAAKLCSVLKGAAYTVADLLKNPAQAVKRVKTVMLPTTCGTGSEATCNAIVAVPEKSVKIGIVNDNMIPDYVILDPALIKKLPKSIIAATGVDALAHAVECYTSLKATQFSNTYALAAAKLIFGNIVQAYDDADNMQAKASMLLGAYYGGVAITGSGTTAVHALSYPLGGKYHIAHGISNAILFAPVMAFNKDACEVQLAELCDAISPERFSLNVAEKAQYVIDRIAKIVKELNIPADLKEFGVSADDIDFLVEAGSQQKRLLVNNRKVLGMEDIRAIYAKVIK